MQRRADPTPNTTLTRAEREVIYTTDQTKQQVLDAKTTEEKIKAVNKILLDGEPANISVDNYSGFTGYKPQYIFDALNAVLHIGGWGFEEISSEVVTTQTEKGTSQLAIAHVKVWLQGIDFQPAGYGQSRVTRNDIGMLAREHRQTQLKRACRSSQLRTERFTDS